MPRLNSRSMSLASQESYSAVIIADMVAEVAVSPLNGERRGSAPSERRASVPSERRGSAPRSPKRISSEMQNFGYNGPLEPEGEPSNSTPRPSLYETNLTKGVILNVAQCGQPGGLKPVKEEQENAIEQGKDSVKDNDDLSDDKPQGVLDSIKEMSFPRKVAFGFSFLPSVLFVLCFAVILPCHLPELCVQELWSITLNGTEVTSHMKLPQDLILSYSKEDTRGVLYLNRSNGDELWNLPMDSIAIYINCDNLDFNQDGEGDCLVMDADGKLYILNTSNGAILWDKTIAREKEETSHPVILSDCNHDGIPEIALAISKAEIRIIYNESSASSINTSSCNGSSSLLHWPMENETNLILYCETVDTGSVIKIPENKWCMKNVDQLLEDTALLSGNAQSFQKSIFLPTPHGLLVWSENDVSLVQPNGSTSWNASSQYHSQEKRFMKTGRFNGKEMQVALFSSDLQKSFQVTLYSLLDGRQMWFYRIPNAEVSDINILKAGNTDFVLMQMKKVTLDLTLKAVSQINEVTSTIVNLLTDEVVNGTLSPIKYQSIFQEIVIMVPSEKEQFYTVHKELLQPIDDSFTTFYAANVTNEQEKNSLFIVLADTYKAMNKIPKLTKLRSIRVKNWIASQGNSECTW